MFRIYTGGSCPVGSTSPYHKYAHSSFQPAVAPQYDHMEFSPVPGGIEKKMKETVGRLSQEARTHVSSRDLEQLRQQVSGGYYQPSSFQIASRMLLMRGEG